MANEHLFQPKRSADTFAGSDNGGLGGFRSADVVADVASTITAVTDDRTFEDSTQISAADRVGAFIYFLDTNLGEIHEVVEFDDTTGEFKLDVALGITPVVTDRYWLFMPNALFNSFDAAACRTRDLRHRLIYLHNTTGGQLDDVAVYVVPIIEGPIECRVAVGLADFPQSTNFDVTDLADENAVPPLSHDSGFQKTGSAEHLQQFRRPLTLAGGFGSPYGTDGVGGQKAVPDTRERPIFIQLGFPANAPIPRAGRAVYAIFIDGEASASVAVTIVVVDIAGVSEEIVAVVDRRLRLHGGARISARVRDSVAPNENVPGGAIALTINSGPGTMGPVSADPIQVDDPVRRVYLTGSDSADVGDTVEFKFEVS